MSATPRLVGCNGPQASRARTVLCIRRRLPRQIGARLELRVKGVPVRRSTSEALHEEPSRAYLTTKYVAGSMFSDTVASGAGFAALATRWDRENSVDPSAAVTGQGTRLPAAPRRRSCRRNERRATSWARLSVMGGPWTLHLSRK